MATSVNNNNMEIDMNISDMTILREVITFLECLRDVKLPLKFESLREELLVRAKNTLSITRASSPDRPYLDMNSGPKSLLLIKNETDSEEYVGMEGSQKQPHQDYYETCENQGKKTPSSSVTLPKSPERHTDHEFSQETQKLLEIYKNLSAAQSKSKCHKCGPLYRKEGKKLFLSESRACWIALVGSHLLIYRNERHNRPYAIYPIRGYMARAAPNLIPRDRQKSDAAFEIYKPGNETLQFIARTPKDMDQWIAKVCEVGCGNEMNSNVKIHEKPTATNESPSLNHHRNNKEMRHQGVPEKPMATNKSSVESSANHHKDEKKKRGKDTVENPPPLPSRIPRRLPSLPPDSAIPSYKVDIEYVDDDDDEIYHKIEDLVNGTCYQNLRRRRAIDEQQDIISYDDIHGSNVKDGEQVQVMKSDDTISQEEMYDDIVTLSRTNVNTTRTEHQDNQNGSDPVVEEEKEEFYDDVENLISSKKFAKDHAKDQADTSSKSPQKKSFLGRVLSRKESSGKSPEKKYKGKVSSSNAPSSSIAAEEMPTYDDVSDLTANQEFSANDEELPEYNCPPPPRPVYKSPVTNSSDNQVEEIYDDVNICREQYNKSHQQTSPQSTEESRMKEAKSDASMCNMDMGMNDDLSEEEIEHYQSPRSDLRICDIQQTTEIPQIEEDLYDDVALLTGFKARQRSMAEQKDNEDSRSTSSPDKKSWNRFGVNRRSRTSDASSTYAEQTNRRNSNDCEETEDALDKKNTFKKLISKMENSLARVSTRNSTSPLIAKSSTANNNF